MVAAAPAPVRYRRLLPVLLALFGFLGALDQNVIVTALPRMLGDTDAAIVRFGASGAPAIGIDRAGWLITGYLLGYVVALPLMGAVSDVWGRRQVLLGALAVFAVGSVLVAVATSLTALVLARTIQACGGGALLPVALAAASDVVSPRRRGLALGAIAAASELGGVCGPLYGAVIAQHSDLGWRLIFWLNVPVVAALAAATLLLPTFRTRRAVDYRGGLLLGAALAALVVGTSSSGVFGSDVGGGNASRLFLLLCVGLCAVLPPVERRAAHPLLPLAIVRRAPFAAACLVNGLVGVALGVTVVAIPLYATTVRASTPVGAGLLLLRYLLLLVVGAALGGWLRDRVGARGVAVAGLAVAAFGAWLLRDWLVSPPHQTGWLAPALAGFGIGMVAAPVTTAALGVAGAGMGGTLASLVTAARVAGMMAGLSAIASWGSWRFGVLAAGIRVPRVPPHGGLGGLQHALTLYGIALQAREIAVLREIFAALAVICAIAALPALLLGGRR